MGLVGPKVFVPLLDTLQKVCPNLHSCKSIFIFTLWCTLGIFNYLKSWKMGTWLYLHLKKLLLILNILVSLKNNFSMFFAHFSYWYSSFLLVYTSPQYIKPLSYVKVFVSLKLLLVFQTYYNFAKILKNNGVKCYHFIYIFGFDIMLKKILPVPRLIKYLYFHLVFCLNPYPFWCPGFLFLRSLP